MPSSVTLLHGALRMESYIAITKIRCVRSLIILSVCPSSRLSTLFVTYRDDWFGILHSWADSKKKSNLVLSVFKPGVNSVPWLGNLNMLGLADQPTASLPYKTLSLPVPVTDKKSYSSSAPSWLRQSTLQSDIQKLLRYGRKLPEKLNVFYKVSYPFSICPIHPLSSLSPSLSASLRLSPSLSVSLRLSLSLTHKKKHNHKK